MIKEKITALVKKESKPNKKKIENLVFALILLMITVIFINNIFSKDKNEIIEKDTITQKTIAKKEKERDLETDLEDILKKIKGIEDVQVLITYSETELTNQDVIATISFNKPNVIVENGNTHTFTKNGEYTFEYVDEAGNNGMTTAIVNWIDKVSPTAKVTYDITEMTDKNVVATLTDASEEITITNNDGKNTYTFTENGEFKFEIVDNAGNKGTVIAKVTWINKNNDFIFESDNYTIEENFISMIRPGIDDKKGTTVKEFKENITTNQSIKVIYEGEELSDDDIVVTGMILKVGEDLRYTLVVRGDIDGDGEITINDLAKLRLHCIEKELLTSERLIAADVDNDGEITINDVAQLKLILIGVKDI